METRPDNNTKKTCPECQNDTNEYLEDFIGLLLGEISNVEMNNHLLAAIAEVRDKQLGDQEAKWANTVIHGSQRLAIESIDASLERMKRLLKLLGGDFAATEA